MGTKTEAQILESWSNQEPPLVSIICITYNHEHYITDAIEGFLNQETPFSFEIIIHDDASTDKTTEIIKNYVKKYPRIIKPIFQKENQSSQLKKNALLPIMLTAISHAQGEFIAYCDGDDYWIDSHKLKIQIGEMQKNQNCDVSFHPVFCQFINKKKKWSVTAKHASHNTIYKTERLIIGEARFCPTVSFIFKKYVFDTIPAWLFDAPCTDYFLQILASQNGGALYINKVMAVYRVFSCGSWTRRMIKEEDLVYKYFIGMLKALEDVNGYTHNQYVQAFRIIKMKLCFFMCINPVLSLTKRKTIFQNSKSMFNFERKLIWYLLFRNKKLSRFIFNLKNNMLY